MKTATKIFIVLFLLVGIAAIYMGLNINLQCATATMKDNLLAGLPLSVFGIYCFITALFLWKKTQIGNILAVFTIIMASVLIIAPIFDLSFPIIKTSCLNL
jgi:cytochrome bd-type quinol oxidase subunit 2